MVLIDVKIFCLDLFSFLVGEVGFVVGVEYCYESFFDKWSDELNGILYFSDLVGGILIEIVS